MRNESQTVVVIGAGPAGCTAAIMLGKRGFNVQVNGACACASQAAACASHECMQAPMMYIACMSMPRESAVQVYERRTREELTDPGVNAKTYMLALHPRGLSALREAGVDMAPFTKVRGVRIVWV